MSRLRASEYLGVSVRTIRHWDAGRNRVPWSAVRLLRLVRAGELGGLDDAWEGWTINRHGLRSPCGRVYTVQSLRHWWLVIEQARFWRQGYDLATQASTAQPCEGSGTTATFPHEDFSQGEKRTRETDQNDHPSDTAFPAKPAFTVLPADDSALAEPAAGKGAAAAGRRPGAPCVRTAGMSLSIGMAASASSGCTLPRDVSLTSVCDQKWDFTPVGPYQSPPVSPETNRGQKPPSGTPL